MSVLELSNVRKEYGTVVAVNDVSFSVEQGQVVGLIGPNGAGKTTLLRILATLLRPTSGTISLLGYDLAKQYLRIRKHIGFMPDFFNLYNDLTLAECLDFFARAYGVDAAAIPTRIEQVLDYVGLADSRNKFVRNLSRGMVQRMGVAVLLVHEPEVFLLDEPASGLDPQARIGLRAVLKKLSKQGKTIIISSHILTELSGFCSHLAIMDNGTIKMYGAVDQIEREVCGKRRVVVRTLGDWEKAVACMRRLDGIEVVQVAGNTATIETTGGPEQIAALNAHLVKAGIKVVSLSEEKLDIEDLFMRISGPKQ